jgi:hypothetical protein
LVRLSRDYSYLGGKTHQKKVKIMFNYANINKMALELNQNCDACSSYHNEIKELCPCGLSHTGPKGDYCTKGIQVKHIRTCIAWCVCVSSYHNEIKALCPCGLSHTGPKGDYCTKGISVKHNPMCSKSKRRLY